MGFNVIITWQTLAATAVVAALVSVGLYLRVRRRRDRVRLDHFD